MDRLLPSQTNPRNVSGPAVDFVTMNDLKYQTALLTMMRALYAEDEAASPVDQSRFAANIETLVRQPSRGLIILFQENEIICGYALLIPYWSNEFGGALLYVDELFVMPAARGRGIGTRFITHLGDTRPFDAVALALEVSPRNQRALRLYRSLGFSPRRNSVLTLPLTK